MATSFYPRSFYRFDAVPESLSDSDFAHTLYMISRQAHAKRPLPPPPGKPGNDAAKQQVELQREQLQTEVDSRWTILRQSLSAQISDYVKASPLLEHSVLARLRDVVRTCRGGSEMSQTGDDDIKVSVSDLALAVVYPETFPLSAFEVKRATTSMHQRLSTSGPAPPPLPADVTFSSSCAFVAYVYVLMDSVKLAEFVWPATNDEMNPSDDHDDEEAWFLKRARRPITLDVVLVSPQGTLYCLPEATVSIAPKAFLAQTSTATAVASSNNVIAAASESPIQEEQPDLKRPRREDRMDSTTIHSAPTTEEEKKSDAAPSQQRVVQLLRGRGGFVESAVQLWRQSATR